MSEKLCKKYKILEEITNIDEYMKLISKPKYLCLRCGRVSKKKENVCKPLKIKE